MYIYSQARQAHRQLARVPDGPHGEEGQGVQLQGGEQGGGEARRGQDGNLEEELEVDTKKSQCFQLPVA